LVKYLSGGTFLPTSTQAQRQFEEEERAYWQNRDVLMQQYAGKWVAVVGGQVVASGDQMNKVAAEAWRKTGSGVMYVSLVGQEDVVLRVRRAQGRYDSSYAPPIPTVAASVIGLAGNGRAEVTFVVDTGADLTLLRQTTADRASLWDNVAGHVRVAGIGGQPERRPVYNALVAIAGQSILTTADCRDDIGEDILGRDVINEFSLTLCEKRDQVEFGQA
jgi:hypothetical protein